MGKKLTPLTAIRKFCLWCCGAQASIVDECVSKWCPLHSYRHGKRNPYAEYTPVKTMRRKCLECVGGPADVKTCEVTDCQLHGYRMGKTPRSKVKLDKDSEK